MTSGEFLERNGIKLNIQQEEAVRSVDGAVLVLAVPGSGKTTVLVTRLGYMIKGLGIRPDSILTMTYTRAATADMRQRYVRFFGDGEDVPDFRTINSVCVNVLKHFERKRNRKTFTLVNDEKVTGPVLRAIYQDVMREYPTDSDIKDIRTGISYVKNMMINPSEYDDKNIGTDKFVKIFDGYSKWLVSNRLMDYDDQLSYAYAVLKNYPEILRAFQDHFRYICVDEAQDTSRIQHEIIRLLVGDNNNIFMVGDEDQSIYGFRAAYPQALVSFEKVFKNAKVLLMEENFRSTKNIVSVSDALIQKNRTRHKKKMTTRNDEGRPINIIPAKDEFSQYTYLLKVAQNCSRQTAVLFRNNESAVPLINMLDKKGIPFSYRQTDAAFFTNRIVTDIVSILQFALNPYDRDLFMNIYYKMNSALKLSKIAALSICEEAAAGRKDIVWVMASNPQYYRGDATKLFTGLMRAVKRSRPEWFIDRIYEDLGYGEYMDNNHFPKQRIQILKSIASQEATVESFLSRLISLEETVRERTMNDSPFILSTIHSSKGLEYDKVILMDIQDGILPSADSLKDSRLMEEERRLFYVGMTRAKNYLSIFDLSATGNCRFTNEVKVLVNPSSQKGSSGEKTKIPSVYGRIRHEKFGAGTVIESDGKDVITVSFDDGRTKKFSWKLLVESGSLIK